MELAGQPSSGERGYAMAALLVGMSIMAVLMSALLPVWTHMATREKEEEMIFRGKQYARAVGLFERKFANTPPPTIDILVEQRFLRKKYKDPITNDDFQPIFANQAVAQGSGTSQTAQQPGQATSTTQQSNPGQTLQSGLGSTGTGPQGGVIGVTSKSKETSIKLYNGRSKYNEWAFVYIQTAQRPGQSAGPGLPNGQGQPGQQNGPFGMQNGPTRVGGPPGQRQNGQPPFGTGQPNRPPIVSPAIPPQRRPQGQ